MRRRSFLGCLSLFLAGCLDNGDSKPGPGKPDNEPPFRLRIENQAEQQLAVEVTLTVLTDQGEPTGRSTTESYTLVAGSQISLDQHIEPSTDYRVAVNISGGASDSWNLYPYSGITVEIKSPDQMEDLIVEV